MNYTGISNWRNNAAKIFEGLRFRAIVVALSARLFGKDIKLKSFTEQIFRINSLRIRLGEPVFRINSTRNYVGEQDIPVERINGSVGRENDFDSNFRPLKGHLRERWIDAYALFVTNQFSPIQLFKIGNDYYVEDGHLRVSVAHTLGLTSLRARVWDIPQPGKKANYAPCLPKSKKYGPVMEHAWQTKGEVL